MAAENRGQAWRRRACSILLAMGLMSMVLSPALAYAGDAAPTLGSSGLPQAEGFGEVRPPVVFLGGDPSGLVSHIHWRRWGKPKAIGQGTGWWIPEGRGTSGGRPARARLVAWDLGTCAGRRSYLRFEWYFPEFHREAHRPSGSFFSTSYAIHTCGAQ